MYFQRLLISYAVVSGLFFAPLAMAQEIEATGTVAMFAEVEKFTWEEFVPKNNKVLEESGSRAAVGVAWSNLRTATEGPVYRAYGKLYGGIVDYDGQTLGGTVASTETNYLGLQAEGLGGYRFGGRVGFELVSAIGFDAWQRNIQDGQDAVGNPVTGFNEFYAVLNAKLGVGFFARGESFGFALRAGPKLPLVAWERAYLFDGVDLMPKPNVSWFGTAEFSFGGRGKDRFTLSLYYDSYRFRQSDTETLTSDGIPVAIVAQPDTDMTVYGARFAFGF